MFIHSKNLSILNKESDTRMVVFLGHFLPPFVLTTNKNVEEMADPGGGGHWNVNVSGSSKNSCKMGLFS